MSRSSLGPDLRLLSIVNALETSPTWESTAVVVVWDDWGGYYDHVAPPVTADGHQLGMRVPMLLLSPWAQGGTVSHQTLDHSSIPALATSLFGLDPIVPHTRRDRAGRGWPRRSMTPGSWGCPTRTRTRPPG